MNDPENTFSDSSTSEAAQLRQQLRDLQRHSHFLEFGLVIISFALAGFLWLQSHRARNDLTGLRPQATQVIELNKRESPQIQAIVSQLQAYGRGHPDYAQRVLAKYGIRTDATTPATTVPGPAAAPAGR